MKVAVTGARGRVGRFVVKELLDCGYEVLALTHRPWEDCPVEQVSVDVMDFEQVYNCLEGSEAVIHLAAIPSPRKNADSLVFKTNMLGAYNILMAAGMLGIERVAIASSDCALGFTYSANRPVPVYLPVDEVHPSKADDCYGLSKVLSERMGDAIPLRFPGMSIASLRITYVAKPEEYQAGTPFSKWMDDPMAGPWNLWSYIDGRDAARAFRLAIETDLGGHEVFYIAASDTRMPVPSMELIQKYFPDAAMKLNFTGYESLENSLKAERLLGFKAAYSWRDVYTHERRNDE